MTDQTDPPTYSTAPEDRPTDLVWAERVALSLDDDEPEDGYTVDYDTTVPTRRLHSVLKTLIDQAAELESLRDRGDQSTDAVISDAIDTARELNTAGIADMMGGPVSIHPAIVRHLVDGVLALAARSPGQPGVIVVPDTEAVRIIADAEEADQLPTGSVIIDDRGEGAAWLIEEKIITDPAIPGMAGRNVRGLLGFGGTAYSVVYPAVLIHTPKEHTA